VTTDTRLPSRVKDIRDRLSALREAGVSEQVIQAVEIALFVELERRLAVNGWRKSWGGDPYSTNPFEGEGG